MLVEFKPKLTISCKSLKPADYRKSAKFALLLSAKMQN